MTLVRRTRRIPKILIDNILGSGQDQPGFKVEHINSDIGFGVFTTADFEKGDFLLEYAGKLYIRFIFLHS